MAVSKRVMAAKSGKYDKLVHKRGQEVEKVRVQPVWVQPGSLPKSSHPPNDAPRP